MSYSYSGNSEATHLRSRAEPEKKATKRMVMEALLTLGLPDHANQDLFLKTTDRLTVRAKAVVVARIDIATVVEVQAVRVAAIRRC